MTQTSRPSLVSRVQAYVLELLEARQTASDNESAYHLASRLYLQAKALHDAIAAEPATSGIQPVAALEPPVSMTLDSATGKRSYQGADYQDYIGKYTDYIQAYIAYAQVIQDTQVLQGQGPDASGLALPAAKTAVLLSDDDAKDKIASYAWKTYTLR